MCSYIYAYKYVRYNEYINYTYYFYYKKKEKKVNKWKNKPIIIACININIYLEKNNESTLLRILAHINICVH